MFRCGKSMRAYHQLGETLRWSLAHGSFLSMLVLFFPTSTSLCYLFLNSCSSFFSTLWFLSHGDSFPGNIQAVTFLSWHPLRKSLITQGFFLCTVFLLIPFPTSTLSEVVPLRVSSHWELVLQFCLNCDLSAWLLKSHCPDCSLLTTDEVKWTKGGKKVREYKSKNTNLQQAHSILAVHPRTGELEIGHNIQKSFWQSNIGHDSQPGPVSAWRQVRGTNLYPPLRPLTPDTITDVGCVVSATIHTHAHLLIPVIGL